MSTNATEMNQRLEGMENVNLSLGTNLELSNHDPANEIDSIIPYASSPAASPGIQQTQRTDAAIQRANAEREELTNQIRALTLRLATFEQTQTQAAAETTQTATQLNQLEQKIIAERQAREQAQQAAAAAAQEVINLKAQFERETAEREAEAAREREAQRVLAQQNIELMQQQELERQRQADKQAAELAELRVAQAAEAKRAQEAHASIAAQQAQIAAQQAVVKRQQERKHFEETLHQQLQECNNRRDRAGYFAILNKYNSGNY